MALRDLIVGPDKFILKQVVALADAIQVLEPWFNVKLYGAVGDGVVNDTSAVQAAVDALNAAGRGVLYFPAGSYITSGGFTISVPARIVGDGMSDPTTSGLGFGTRINCTSTTATLFTVTSLQAEFRNLSLLCTTTPTAGAGIKATHATLNYPKVDYHNVLVCNFYDDIDVEVGANWVLHNGVLLDPIRHGIRIRNIRNGDTGDWTITNTTISEGARPASYGISFESSGGAKISNLKINGDSSGNNFQDGINCTLTTPMSTGIFLINNCSIENTRGHGVYAEGIHLISITGCEFGLYGNSTGNVVRLKSCSEAVISNIVAETGVASNIGFWIEDCTKVQLGMYALKDYSFPVNFAGTYSLGGVATYFNPVSTFSNSWANTGGVFSAAGYGYYNGRVELTGMVTGGTINTSIFTLPVGFRPSRPIVQRTYCNGGDCTIVVNTDGTVVQGDAASNVNVSLDPISFIPARL